MLPIYSNDKEYKSSSRSRRLKETLNGWARVILSDSTSRNIFAFLLLNFSFAFVELLYGYWTNSLGLISDSIHMFFDCTALVVGLVASVVTKNKANDKYSYGYVRAEILGGIFNGLFLAFIGLFILKHAVERLFEPPEVKHDRLLVISVLGLIVNLVGIFVFQHGGAHHGHSHGGDNHGHSHSSNNHSIANNEHGHNHSHGDHSHGHHHDNHTREAPKSQIMQGVFLHVLADTLGSVGVIISTFLMSQFGWMIADPICSIFIAAMVFISTWPLLRESSSVLMQRTPGEIEHLLPNCYQRIRQLEEVYNINDTHFWTLCSGRYVGTLRIEVSNRADPRYILKYVENIFNQIGVHQLTVQIDYSTM